MKVKGTNMKDEEVEFEAHFCTCPMQQGSFCGHWLVSHTKECELGCNTTYPETVKSCFGGWYGSRAYLNSKESLAKHENRGFMVYGTPWSDYDERNRGVANK